MELLGIIHRHPGLNTHGRTSFRQAVRAIILRGQELLMVYSPVNGDYKFPGGGVDPDEDHAEALRREVNEECGAYITKVGPSFGEMIEYDFPEDPQYDVFKMTSSYYLCEVGSDQTTQRLDPYEADLKFEPAWVGIAEATRTNTAVLHATGREIPYWTRRETFVLQEIQRRLFPDTSPASERTAP